MNDADDMGALKSFIDENEDLEGLEELLNRFNLFESLGLVRQEIRHSAFLCWLLDPAETHGQGDYWLRQFLRMVIKNGEGVLDNAPSLFDLDEWNLGRAEVRKEWRNIDVLILDEDNRFVCAIENKVDSTQSKGQLNRYWKIVEREFGGFKRVYVFLTRAKETPEHDAYVSINYGDVAGVVGNGLKKRQSQLDGDVKLFIQQYLDMVRRHIVENSEIQELSRRIYKNHRRALDLIIEHRPDRASEVAQIVQDFVKSRNDLIPISLSKTYIKFLPESMNLSLLRHGGSFLIAWLLENKNRKVRFRLELQPGPPITRQQIYKRAEKLPHVFGKPKTKLSPMYHTFFSETWISGKEYDEWSAEEIAKRVEERISRLLERKGKEIRCALEG